MQEVLERRQRPAVEHGDEGGASGVSDPGSVEVEPLEYLLSCFSPPAGGGGVPAGGGATRAARPSSPNGLE